MSEKQIYLIHTISEVADIKECPFYHMDQFNWGGDYRPVSYGQLAYLQNQGFLLKMSCEESNPICRYHKNFEPVWMDSAMEGFFSFQKDSSAYINLEVNSAGAIVAAFGTSSIGRRDFTAEDVSSLCCQASSTAHSWSIELFIPLTLIQKYFSVDSFKSGDCIRMNFFKIAQGDITTHFASYTPIDYPTPNFHLPEFFAEGIIQ